jgi:hypothetical protein
VLHTRWCPSGERRGHLISDGAKFVQIFACNDPQERRLRVLVGSVTVIHSSSRP